MRASYIIMQATFSQMVNELMKAKRMRQSDLVSASLLSKSMVSRICKDSNSRGANFNPPLLTVMAVSIGLKLTEAEAKSLFFAAYPEIEFWSKFLREYLDIDRVNAFLYDNGLHLLGKEEEE